jgi:hypothetical protein
MSDEVGVRLMVNAFAMLETALARPKGARVKSITDRALDALAELVAATPQEGPAAHEFAIDREALADVRETARTLLYEARGEV